MGLSVLKVLCIAVLVQCVGCYDGMVSSLLQSQHTPRVQSHQSFLRRELTTHSSFFHNLDDLHTHSPSFLTIGVFMFCLYSLCCLLVLLASVRIWVMQSVYAAQKVSHDQRAIAALTERSPSRIASTFLDYIDSIFPPLFHDNEAHDSFWQRCSQQFRLQHRVFPAIESFSWLHREWYLRKPRIACCQKSRVGAATTFRGGGGGATSRRITAQSEPSMRRIERRRKHEQQQTVDHQHADEHHDRARLVSALYLLILSQSIVTVMCALSHWQVRGGQQCLQLKSKSSCSSVFTPFDPSLHSCAWESLTDSCHDITENQLLSTRSLCVMSLLLLLILPFMSTIIYKTTSLVITSHSVTAFLKRERERSAALRSLSLTVRNDASLRSGGSTKNSGHSAGRGENSSHSSGSISSRSARSSSKAENDEDEEEQFAHLAGVRCAFRCFSFCCRLSKANAIALAVKIVHWPEKMFHALIHMLSTQVVVLYERELPRQIECKRDIANSAMFAVGKRVAELLDKWSKERAKAKFAVASVQSIFDDDDDKDKDKDSSDEDGGHRVPNSPRNRDSSDGLRCEAFTSPTKRDRKGLKGKVQEQSQLLYSFVEETKPLPRPKESELVRKASSSSIGSSSSASGRRSKSKGSKSPTKSGRADPAATVVQAASIFNSPFLSPAGYERTTMQVAVDLERDIELQRKLLKPADEVTTFDDLWCWETGTGFVDIPPSLAQQRYFCPLSQTSLCGLCQSAGAAQIRPQRPSKHEIQEHLQDLLFSKKHDIKHFVDLCKESVLLTNGVTAEPVAVSHTHLQIGHVILSLFVSDLMGGRNTPEARLFESIALNYSPHVILLRSLTKWLLIIALLASTALLTIVALLLAYQHSIAWQVRVCSTIIIVIVLEMIVIQTIETFFCSVIALEHVCGEKVREVREKLRALVRKLVLSLSMSADARSTERVFGEHRLFFNSADYFFLSPNIARAFPFLIESLLVLHYNTHLPPNDAPLGCQLLPASESQAQLTPARHATAWFAVLPQTLQLFSIRVLLLSLALDLSFTSVPLLSVVGFVLMLGSLITVLVIIYKRQCVLHDHYMSSTMTTRPSAMGTSRASRSMRSARSTTMGLNASTASTSRSFRSINSNRQLHPDFFPNPQSASSSTTSSPRSMGSNGGSEFPLSLSLSSTFNQSLSQSLAQTLSLSPSLSASEGFQRDLPMLQQASHSERVRALRRDFVLLRTFFDETLESDALRARAESEELHNTFPIESKTSESMAQLVPMGTRSPSPRVSNSASVVDLENGTSIDSVGQTTAIPRVVSTFNVESRVGSESAIESSTVSDVADFAVLDLEAGVSSALTKMLVNEPPSPQSIIDESKHISEVEEIREAETAPVRRMSLSVHSVSS